MATATQVPWTTPGQPPCCCVDPCFVNITGPEFNYASGYWHALGESDYASLLATGSLQLQVSLLVTSTLDLPFFNLSTVAWSKTQTQEIKQASAATTATLFNDPTNQPCHQKYEGAVTLQTTIKPPSFEPPGDTVTSTQQNVEFTFTLSESSGSRLINLASIQAPVVGNGAPTPEIRLSGAATNTSYLGLDMYVGNVNNSVAATGGAICNGGGLAYLPTVSGVTVTKNLTINGVTYSNSGAALGCFASLNHYNQVVNGQLLNCAPGVTCGATCVGSVTLSAIFIPTAP